MSKRNFFIILIFLVLLALFFHLNYPMTPFEFDSAPGDNQESWYDFKSEAGIELEYWNKEDTQNYWLGDHEDVRFVYNELAKSEVVNFSDYPDNRERFVWFFIRNGIRGNIIQRVDLMENGIAETDEGTYVKVTDELFTYLVELQEKNYIRIPLEDL